MEKKESCLQQKVPDSEYGRLLFALQLKYSPESGRTHLMQSARLLRVSVALVSDCVRRGSVVPSVLKAAEAKGVNPEFIKYGARPILLKKTQS